MKKRMDIYTLTLISLMAALICALGPFTIPLPFSPIPLSLTHLPVFLSLYLLGWRSGTISYLIYLLIGLIGMPVFSGFAGGLGKLAGPTGGYLLGFIFMTVISGMIIEKTNGRFLPSIIGMAFGNIIVYLFGTGWLCLQMNLGLKEGFVLGVIPYIPGDLLKIIAAALAGPYLKKALSGIHRGKKTLR